MNMRHWMSALLVAAALAAPAHAAVADHEREAGPFARLLELLGLGAGMPQSTLPPIVVIVPSTPPPPDPTDPTWWGSCELEHPQQVCHQN